MLVQTIQKAIGLKELQEGQANRNPPLQDGKNTNHLFEGDKRCRWERL
jgi:hypothetical protein